MDLPPAKGSKSTKKSQVSELTQGVKTRIENQKKIDQDVKKQTVGMEKNILMNL